MKVVEKELNYYDNTCACCGRKEFIVFYNEHMCIHCKDTNLVIEEYWERVKRFGLRKE